jgi:hypothetical protein
MARACSAASVPAMPTFDEPPHNLPLTPPEDPLQALMATAAAHEARLNFHQGEYGQQSSTAVSVDADADDDAEDDGFDLDVVGEHELELLAQIHNRASTTADGEGASGEDHPRDQALRELEAELKDFLAQATDPLKPRRGKGPELYVGLDAEWVQVADGHNRILSVQLFVPPQPGMAQPGGKPADAKRLQRKIERLNRILYARGPLREQRPKLGPALQDIVGQAIAERVIAEEPSAVVVVGFGLRFDLAALGDFNQLKREVDSVAGKIATVHAQTELSMDWVRVGLAMHRARQAAQAPASLPIDERQEPPARLNLASKEVLQAQRLAVRFIDVASFVPVGVGLRWIGELLQCPKLDIELPYSIERMDEFLALDPKGFKAYAMRDAEIAVKFALRLRDFARQRLQVQELPASSSSLALQWFLGDLSTEQWLSAFGLERVRHEAWHARTRRRVSSVSIEPTPMRRIQEAFLTYTFHGGRNECFWLGPSDPAVGTIRDFDLAGAYTTGLLDLPPIDWSRPRHSLDVADYLGHVAGYALVEFEHPVAVRFPVFGVDTGSHGLVFPRRGVAYATAPEIRAAHDLHCRMRIRWGVILPWVEDKEHQPQDRLFYRFVKRVREMRDEFNRAEIARAAQAQEEPGKSLEEQITKLLGNALTGKCSQGLRPKRVYDPRGARSVQLKPSAITNPAVAAHITGFIRAVLAEIMNRIPADRVVYSCTTDGFLSSASQAEVDLSGPLSRRFAQLCEWVLPGSQMLEVKHVVGQVVCMKTRGQLTSRMPATDPWIIKADCSRKRSDEIVLAKAGVQPVVETRGLSAKEICARQNEAMLRAYLERTPNSTVTTRAFPSIRDQWEKGLDLTKVESQIRMSLEPDLKRRLVRPHEHLVVSQGVMHLAADSEPWNTVDDFQAARARLEQFRDQRCLKTLADYLAFDTAQQVAVARRQARTAGQKNLLNLTKRGEADMLRRAFLRAYVVGGLGLAPVFDSYPEVARWLTGIGQKTTTQDVKDAKVRSDKAGMVLGQVPRTASVLALLAQLREMFPQADLEALLVKG